VIKFIIDGISTPHEINPIDRGILELKSAVENLHAQVDGLQHKIDEFSLIFLPFVSNGDELLVQMHAEG
jgi:hypothetical protein